MFGYTCVYSYITYIILSIRNNMCTQISTFLSIKLYTAIPHVHTFRDNTRTTTFILDNIANIALGPMYNNDMMYAQDN